MERVWTEMMKGNLLTKAWRRAGPRRKLKKGAGPLDGDGDTNHAQLLCSKRSRDDLTASESESGDEDEIAVSEVRLYKPEYFAPIGLTCESSEDLRGAAVVQWCGGASRGMLHAGDIIDAVDGVPLNGATDLAARVRATMGEIKLNVRSRKSSGKSRCPPPPPLRSKKTPPPLPAHFVRQGVPGSVRFVRQEDAPALALQNAGPLSAERRRLSCGDAASLAREQDRATFDVPPASSASRPRCGADAATPVLINGRRFDRASGFEAGWGAAPVHADDPINVCARQRQRHCERMLSTVGAEATIVLPDAPGPEFERTCKRMSADFSVE